MSAYFDWKWWANYSKREIGFTQVDLSLYPLEIVRPAASTWRVSVYKLTPKENRLGNQIYIETLCNNTPDRQRAPYIPVLWGWEGMSSTETNQIGAIFSDKPAHEIKSHPINEGQNIWLEIHGGDRLYGLRADYTDLPDAEEYYVADVGREQGNSTHNHSWFVCFAEIEPGTVDPPPADSGGGKDHRNSVYRN